MKRNFKILITLFVIMVCTLTSYNVKAADTVTLTKKSYITYNGRVEAKFYTTKGYAYCITPQKVGGKTGQQYSFSNVDNDKGLLYIVDQSGTDDMSYLMKQLAVWKYRSNFMPSAFVGTSLGNKAEKLASTAKTKASSYTGTKVSISLKTTSSTMSLTSDNKYYQSGSISVNLTGSSEYSVSVSGNSAAQVVNSSGGVLTGKIKSGQNFFIRIPVAKVTTATTITVSVSAYGTEGVIRRYNSGSNSIQDIVIKEAIAKNVSASTKINVTPIKRVCEYFNGKYYDKNGKETNEVTYKQQCEKNICKKVGDKYFDKNGKETDELTYKQQCEKNICKKVGDKYFDKDGKETNELTYKQQCEKNICKKVGDKYFDKDGKETDELTYKQQCEKNICKKVGDKYFDKDGKETDVLTYKQQCEKNVCKQVGDKYFGIDGTEVTKSEYSEQCEEQYVPIPDTGVNPTKTIISIIVGVAFVVGTAVGIKKYTK